MISIYRKFNSYFYSIKGVTHNTNNIIKIVDFIK